MVGRSEPELPRMPACPPCKCAWRAGYQQVPTCGRGNLRLCDALLDLRRRVVGNQFGNIPGKIIPHFGRGGGATGSVPVPFGSVHIESIISGVHLQVINAGVWDEMPESIQALPWRFMPNLPADVVAKILLPNGLVSAV